MQTKHFYWDDLGSLSETIQGKEKVPFVCCQTRLGSGLDSVTVILHKLLILFELQICHL